MRILLKFLAVVVACIAGASAFHWFLVSHLGIRPPQDHVLRVAGAVRASVSRPAPQPGSVAGEVESAAANAVGVAVAFHARVSLDEDAVLRPVVFSYGHPGCAGMQVHSGDHDARVVLTDRGMRRFDQTMKWCVTAQAGSRVIVEELEAPLDLLTDEAFEGEGHAVMVRYVTPEGGQRALRAGFASVCEEGYAQDEPKFFCHVRFQVKDGGVVPAVVLSLGKPGNEVARVSFRSGMPGR